MFFFGSSWKVLMIFTGNSWTKSFEVLLLLYLIFELNLYSLSSFIKKKKNQNYTSLSIILKIWKLLDTFGQSYKKKCRSNVEKMMSIWKDGADISLLWSTVLFTNFKIKVKSEL